MLVTDGTTKLSGLSIIPCGASHWRTVVVFLSSRDSLSLSHTHTNTHTHNVLRNLTWHHALTCCVVLTLCAGALLHVAQALLTCFVACDLSYSYARILALFILFTLTGLHSWILSFSLCVIGRGLVAGYVPGFCSQHNESYSQWSSLTSRTGTETQTISPTIKYRSHQHTLLPPRPKLSIAHRLLTIATYS